MLAIRLMQLFSDNKSNFKKLTELLGLYLQIRDDYCNLRSAEVIFVQYYYIELGSRMDFESTYLFYDAVYFQQEFLRGFNRR